MLRQPWIALPAALLLAQGPAHTQRLRVADIGARGEWTAVVAGGGSVELAGGSTATLKSPLSTSVAFLQRTVPLEGDYSVQVVVQGVRSDRTGGVFVGVCNAPMPRRGDTGAACDAQAKAYWYPYGWFGTGAGDHALVTLRAPRDHVCWDGTEWVNRWARTKAPTSPEAIYDVRITRSEGRYSLAVLNGEGHAVLAPPDVDADTLNGGLGPDTLVIGDPWRSHTAMELEVISVTINGEPADLGEAGRKIKSKQATFGDDQIKVTVGEPFTISSSHSHHNFPTLQQTSHRELAVAIWASPDASLEAKDCRVAVARTRTAGKRWDDPVVFSGAHQGGHSWIRRKDGTCVWLSYFCRPVDGKTLNCNVGRSRDGREYEWSTGTVSFPEPIKPWTEGNAYMVFARSILEMGDGSLVATMYGYFEGDETYRCVLVRSTDGGERWEYHSTIAYEPQAPGEGCCEPVIARAADGDLVCMMRVNSGLPMWACRSRDNGRTWSRARELPGHATSVFPDMVLMSNGILAAAFGRPGAHIMFSVDGKGRRWTSRTTVYEPTNTDAYTAIREVGPGRLLYVYHESAADEAGKPVNLIRGVFVEVERRE